jgi:hypothetical protein
MMLFAVSDIHFEALLGFVYTSSLNSVLARVALRRTRAVAASRARLCARLRLATASPDRTPRAILLRLAVI